MKLIEVAQFVFLAVGVLAQVILILQQIKRQPSSTDVGDSEEKKYAGADLFGLAFALAAAAFFSLLITDILVFSTDLAATHTMAALAAILIALASATLLLLAWWKNLFDYGILVSSITTLFVLLFSSAGPFGDKGAWSLGTSPETSSLPRLFLLLSLIATAVFYILGKNRTLGGSLLTSSNLWWGLGLLTLFTSFGMGFEFERKVRTDPKNPILTGETAEIYEQLKSKNWDLQEQKNFYLLASEAALEPVYFNHYQATRREYINAQRAGNRQSVKSLSSVEALSLALAELLQNDAAKKPRSSVRFQGGKLIGARNSKNSSRRTGLARLGLLRTYFSVLDENARDAYLSERMRWVHLINESNAARIPLSIPGTTTKARFEATAKLRLELLRFLSFPSEARTPVSRILLAASQDGITAGEGAVNSNRARKNLVLLPDTPEEFFAHRLLEQVQLAERDEAYLAFLAYQLVALESTVDALSARSSCASEDCPQAARELLTRIQELPPNQLDVIRFYGRALGNYPTLIRTLADLHDVDLRPLTRDHNNLLIDFLFGLLNESEADIDELSARGSIQGLHDAIRAKSQETRNTLFLLYQERRLSLPIQHLLDARVLSIAKDIYDLFGADSPDIIEFLDRPFRPALEGHASRLLPKHLSEVYGDFLELPADQQENLLLRLATSLYENEGVHALSKSQSVVAQTGAFNRGLAVGSASLFHVPIFLLCLLIGRAIGSAVRSREQLTDFVKAEEDQAVQGADFILGTPVDFSWRDSVVAHLRSLASKGWGTVALAGRRGIGKSRTLYHLYSQARSDLSSVTVWLSSPSQFDEKDFLTSSLQQLASRVEAGVARSLGAEPLTSRIVRSKLMISSVLRFSLILALTLYFLDDTLYRSVVPTTALAWLPLLLMMMASVVTLTLACMRTQPIDLSSWLERARPDNPQISALYRETRAILAKHGDGLGGTVAIATMPLSKLTRHTVSAILMFFFLLFVLITVSLWADGDLDGETLLAFGSFAGLSLGGYVLTQSSPRADKHQAAGKGQGASVLSLISRYREYAAQVVHRIQNGALGDTGDARLVICIDELDKIVDLEDLRDFVRRIKGIFEIPGVFYYISISEDALSALYLGTAMGKNEIDSSFDHIVQLKPLEVADGSELAVGYLSYLGLESIPDRLPECISALSAGVPRDIIRRCDELKSSNPRSATDAETFVREARERLVHHYRQAGFHQLDLPEPESGHLAELSETLSTSLKAPNEEDEESARLAFLTAVYSMLEVGVNTIDTERWEDFVNQLSDLCYRIPVEPPFLVQGDLLDTLEKFGASTQSSSAS